MKKGTLLASILSFVAIFSNLSVQAQNFTTNDYKKALWMTTRFYGGQRSGDNNWLLYNHLPSGVNASLRGKAFIGDTDAGYDLSGGWHDCGDHVKFGHTEFYSAYMLLKGYAEFPKGYGDYYSYAYTNYINGGDWSWEGNKHASNGIPDVLEEAKHATDFIIKCTKDASTFYYQVGQGGPDHQLWMTAVQMQVQTVGNGGQTRVVYKNPNDASMPSFAGAALALMSRLYRPYDAAYADLCLVHAKYAYAYAKTKQWSVAGTGDGGFYGANNNAKDDYATMCAELFWATNDTNYKNEALNFTVGASSGSADIYFNYAFDYSNNGDVAIYNLALLGHGSAKGVLNTIVNNQYKANVQGDGQYSGGNTTWGTLRYNANAAFIVALNQKLQGTDATPDAFIYKNIDYILGKNNNNQSFIVGFGTKSPQHPHHRNVYLVDNNPSNSVQTTMTIPTKNAQMGALVGGSRNPSTFNDYILDYQYTEPGIDYNVCLVGVLGYINSILAPVGPSHPIPDLGADQSICGVSSILLDSKIPTDGKKTFTWKKDGVTVAGPSTTAKTYTATAAGTYTCTLDSAGLWNTVGTMKITSTLPTVNLGSSKNLCNPTTATLDLVATGTGITYSWKKNNVTIAGATSKTYTAVAAGTYTGTISATGCTSQSSSVTITSSLLNANHDTLCSAGKVNLSVSGSAGPFNWYDAATNGTLLNTGSTYAPSITSNKTYYVQDGSSVSATAGPLSASHTLTGATNQGNIGITFTALSAFNITSMKVVPYVYSCNAGDNVTLSLTLTKGGVTIGTYTATPVPCTGVQSGAPFNTYYTMNFPTPIPVASTGDYVITPSAGNALVWYSGGANYSTMGASGIVTITGPTSTYQPNSFPGIFDIKISSGSQCARTPVYAVIDPANPTCTTTDIDAAVEYGLKVFPNPTTDYFVVESNQAMEIRVVDNMGKSVESFELNNSNYAFGKNYKAGMYHIMFEKNGEIVKTMHIIKQ